MKSVSPPEIYSADLSPWYERATVVAPLLLLATILPYLNTFNVPWYLDDTKVIVDNPLIRDLPRTVQSVLQGRGMALLTFALNYRIGGLDLAGYHVVNLLIHALCVLAVWRLLCKLLPEQAIWQIFGAILFAVHPVQTQAVTYVVQRMASLSALFFIGSVYCYLEYLDSVGRRRMVFYGAALLGSMLAILTKEHTAVLPIVLLLAERYFHCGRRWKEQLLGALPFCFAPAWKAIEMLLLPVWRGDMAASAHYADQLQSMQNVTPLRYLFTEFSVIWYYLKLMFLPLGQMFDYGWPVVERLVSWQNIVALAGIVGLWVIAWGLRDRRPLISFGIFWFFIALSVESSFIPLDPIFEHRLYLPMVGFVLVLIDLARSITKPKWQFAVTLVVLLPLALLTWERNALWSDAVAFMEDNLRRSPGNVRVMVMLGNAYAANNRREDGLHLIEEALSLNDKYDFAYTALGKMFIDQGKGVQAIPSLLKGLQYQPRSVVLNEYLGIAYGQAGEYEKSLAHLRRALLLDPEDASIYTNIGVVYNWLGNNRQAAEYFERSLRLAPDSEQALFNYASTLFSLGDISAALNALRSVAKINPANADAQYGLGALAFKLGKPQETVAARDALRRLGDEERAQELDLLLRRNP